MCTKSIIDEHKPGRTKLRTGVIGPKFTNSKVEGVDAKQAVPHMGNMRPECIRLRRNISRLDCKRSEIDTSKPTRAKLNATKFKPEC